MLPFLREHHADPGRLHAEGRVTRVALEDARSQVAEFFGARPREVVFMSSGTEAVNTAAWGALTRGAGAGHVVTTAVEHSSVRDAVARSDTELTIVGVDGTGRFDAGEVIAALRADTQLVSVQLANHEVGTLQPAAEVCAAARERGIIVHVDACAAGGSCARRLSRARRRPLFRHCAQARWSDGRRCVTRAPRAAVHAAPRRRRAGAGPPGGIENVPAWVGFGAACAAVDLDNEAAAQRALISAAAAVIDRVPDVERFGSGVAASTLPNVLCLGVRGVEAEPILLALDQHGVAVHSGSSCSSETLEPSPVLAAMGVDADHSLRISVGWSSTVADVERFVEVFPGIVERLRGLRSP